MAENTEHQITFNIADVEKTVNRAERKINRYAGTKPGHVRDALSTLYTAKATVSASLAKSSAPEKNILKKLLSRIETLIETNLNELTSGPPELDAKEIKFSRSKHGKDFLGQGSFGLVYKGTLAGSKVAVKIPNKFVENMDEFRREVQIMRKLFHPNIVMLIGASTNADTGEVFIVSELMAKDLEEFMSSGEYAKFDLGQRIKLAKDIALGLNWLNTQCNIVHRDIKLGNILIDDHNVAKIADFGFSQVKTSLDDIDGEANPKGNIMYMAPEVMMGKPYNQSADVYGYGLILWEVVTGQFWEPPLEFSQKETYKKFICELEERPPIPKTVSPILRKLMAGCWAPQPNDRPQFKEVIALLNEAYIDFKLPRPEAAKFWKDYFYNKNTASFDESVSWRYLKNLLRSTLSEGNYYGLEAIMCWNWSEPNPSDQKATTVSIEMFGKVQRIFGRFFLNESCYILPQLSKMVRNKAFHGFINREKAQFRLSGREKGYYLIRISDSVKGCPLTITYSNGNNGQGNARVRLYESTDERNVFYYKVISAGEQESSVKPHKSLQSAIEAASVKLTNPCPKFPVAGVHDYNVTLDAATA